MHWEITEKVASGTFGTIYKVQHQKTSEITALKIIHSNLQSPHQRYRIKRGFISASKINHPNCVQMIEWYEANDQYGFVMEYVAGESILSLKKANLSRIINALIQVCNGLNALHSHNIIHRDLKPSNILITPSNQIKITDFDLIKIDKNLTALTSPGAFVGTIKYASPEQCRNASEVDSRSDLYSLGVLFYQLITGELPFDGQSFTEIALAHLRSPFISPCKYVPNLPPIIENIIKKLLEKNPKDRYQSARDVATDLKAIINKNDLKTQEITYPLLLSPSFCGRKKELSTLEACFTSVSRGNFRGILLSGEAGVGKTKLWQEYSIGLKLNHIPVLETKCCKNSGIYTPIGDIILQGFSLLDEKSDLEKAEIVGELGWDLALLAPELGQKSFMEKIAKFPKLQGKAAKIRLFEAITNFLKNIVTSLPLAQKSIVLFFDDLHYADPEIINWLQYASRNLIQYPIFLGAAYRPQEMTYMEKLENFYHSDIIHLSPLSSEDVSQMLKNMMGRQKMPSDFCDQLFTKTGGNPHFIIEMMHFLWSDEKINFDEDGWQNSLKNTPLPQTIQEAIIGRLKQLSPETIKVLKLAAICGNIFNLEILEKTSNFNQSQLMEHLEDVRSGGIIRSLDKSQYEFSQSPTREVLEKMVSPDDKKNIHQHIGDLLERKLNKKSSTPNLLTLEELAYHFYCSENYEKTVKFSEKAGDKAAEKYAHFKAIQYYDWALESQKKLSNTSQQIALLLKKGKILQNVGNWDDGLNCYQQALASCKKINTKILLAKTNQNLGQIYRMKGQYDPALNHLYKSLHIFQKLNEASQIACVMSDIVTVYVILGKYDLADEHTQNQLEISRRIDDKHGILLAMWTLGIINYRKGNHDKAMEFYAQQMMISQEIDDKRGIGSAACNMGAIYKEKGDYDNAMKQYQKFLKISRQIGNKQTISYAIGNIGSIYMEIGDYPAALECFEDDAKICHELGDEQGYSVAIRGKGDVYFCMGELNKAIEFYQKGLGIAKKLGYKHGIASANSAIGKARWWQADYLKALESFEKAIEIWEKLGDNANLLYDVINKGRILLLQNQLNLAGNLGEKALEMASKLNDQTHLLRTKILLAKVEHASGNCGTAIQLLKTEMESAMEENGLALLNYELWKITGEKHYQNTAFDLYRHMYDQTPKFTIKKYLDELKLMASNEINWEIIDSLSRFMNPDTAFAELLSFLEKNCRADACQIIIKNMNSKKFEVHATSPNMTGEDCNFSHSILLDAIRNQKSLLIENALIDPNFSANASIVGKQFLSVIVVPTPISDKAVAALYLDRRQVELGTFRRNDLERVKKIATILTPILIRHQEAQKAKLETEIHNLGIFIGTSKKMRQLYHQISEGAKINFNLCIFGETGTGKELAARALHKLGHRKNCPFIPVNCGAIPKELAESELFGHAKGAFTGATHQQKGKFVLADGGILFLDEIGELSLDIQSKLLRAIEDKEIWPVGGQKPIPVDVQIIAATHRDLADEVRRGTFRSDLFHRLDVLKITVPPLRDRKEDIPALAHHFLKSHSDAMNKTIYGLTENALKALEQKTWEGNVRQLDNTIAKAVFRHSSGQLLTEDDLSGQKQASYPVSPSSLTSLDDILSTLASTLPENRLDAALETVEKYLLQSTLKKYDGHKKNTAQELQISRTRLDRLLKKYKM